MPISSGTMMKKIFLISFLYFGINSETSFANAWRPFKIEMSSLNVTSNDELSYCNGSITSNSEGHDVLNILYTVKYRIMNNLMVNFKLFQMRKNENRVFYIDHTTNLCKTFAKPNLPPVASGLYRHVISRIDMPPKCPIETGVYHATEAGHIEEELPPYIPLNNYKMNLHFFVAGGPMKVSSYCWINVVVRFKPNTVKRNRN